jgi:hypothetical protein
MSGCETIRSEGNDPEKYEFGDATRALIHSGPELRHALSLYCDPETDIIVKRVAIKLLQTYIPYPDEGLCILVEPGLFFGETEIEITE